MLKNMCISLFSKNIAKLNYYPFIGDEFCDNPMQSFVHDTRKYFITIFKKFWSIRFRISHRLHVCHELFKRKTLYKYVLLLLLLFRTLVLSFYTFYTFPWVNLEDSTNCRKFVSSFECFNTFGSELPENMEICFLRISCIMMSS